jgi:hypothetical protein
MIESFMMQIEAVTRTRQMMLGSNDDEDDEDDERRMISHHLLIPRCLSKTDHKARSTRHVLLTSFACQVLLKSTRECLGRTSKSL